MKKKGMAWTVIIAVFLGLFACGGGGSDNTTSNTGGPTSGSLPEGWSYGSHMPTARDWAASSVISSSIYVIGGATGAPYTYDDVERYDTLSNSWTTLPAMPFEEFLIRGATVNGQIYIFGGSLNTLVYRYDPNSRNWTRLQNMPYLDWMGTPAVVNNKVYIFGGTDINGNVVADALEYNPATDTWTTKTPMPTARYAPATAVYNNKIYVLGGNYGTIKNEVYDPATNTWETKAQVPFNNYGWGVAGTIGDKIYFVDSDTYYTPGRMGIYSPATNTWEQINGLNVPREYLTGEVVSGKIYVIGGQDGNGGKSNVVEIYNPPSSGAKPISKFAQVDTEVGGETADYSDFHHRKHLEDLRAMRR